MRDAYAIELKNITKRFGRVVANDHVDLSVRNGEILAILGENGSGKTTLMNMISGIYYSDEGQIFVNGEEVCENDRNSEGEKYWGSGHECLISNFYDKNIFFGLSDIENTHDTMFAMYESAKYNGKEIVL